jgi:hypothetical protein
MNFIFTKHNLLNNLEKIGGWSSYGLAIEALQYYFPHEYDEIEGCDIDRELYLMNLLNCGTWQEIIIKYHIEVGFENFNPEYVNEY